MRWESMCRSTKLGRGLGLAGMAAIAITARRAVAAILFCVRTRKFRGFRSMAAMRIM